MRRRDRIVVKFERFDSVKKTLEDYSLYFEEYLTATAAERGENVPDKLFDAMQYSLSAGGKRLRPSLCLAAAERCGGSRESALPMALGLEMFHTASLIHDDLPCMDDDDMRRGMPSNHKMFGEAMAVLAGDSLLAEAFAYPLSHSAIAEPAKLLLAMKILGRAVGPAGVCGGQALDMDITQKSDPAYVRRIASLKTAALIQASVLCGAALGTDDDGILKSYADYGMNLGFAFQIVDDILDVTGNAAEMGKTMGKDAEQGKITHVTVLGLEKSRALAEEASSAAESALSVILGEEDFLVLLPRYLVHRTN